MYLVKLSDKSTQLVSYTIWLIINKKFSGHWITCSFATIHVEAGEHCSLYGQHLVHFSGLQKTLLLYISTVSSIP